MRNPADKIGGIPSSVGIRLIRPIANMCNMEVSSSERHDHDKVYC